MNESKSGRAAWVIALSVFLAGVLLSSTAYEVLQRAELRRTRENQQQQIHDQFAALQSAIYRHEDGLDSMRTLFEFSAAVTRSEFRGAATRLLTRFPVLEAVEWIPLVPGTERAKVEAAVRAEGFPDYTFRDRVSASPLRFESSPEADEYVAVLYVEPLKKNRSAMGFNVLSGSSAPQFARARHTGLPSMSQVVQLYIEPAGEFGFGVYFPVFAAQSAPGASQGAFRGAVLGLFRLDNFLREAKSLTATQEQYELLVIDRTDPANPAILGLVKPDGTVRYEVTDTPAQFSTAESIPKKLSVWGRNWELIYRPIPGQSGNTLYHSLAVLAWGLIASAALGLFSFAQVTRRAVIEQQVTDRTAELRHAQKLILEEIDARQRTEVQQQQVFERITDAFVALDRNWCYTYLNEKACQLFGRRPEDLLGKHIWTEFPEEVGQKFHLAYERALTDQQPVFLEEYYPPYDRWLENRIYPSPEGLTIYFHDITERKKGEALLTGQKQVLELIATGAPLTETLTTLVRLIEAQSPEMLCTVLLLDADGVHIRHGAAPSLPEEFARAINGQPIGPCAGSCGTAAFRREPVVVEDIATDPLWADYRAFALPHGLRACWSTPIFNARRQVLGTFAIYYRQPERPTTRHQRIIEIATQTAAVAISREQVQAALRLSESRHRRLVESNIIGVMIANTDGRIIEANEMFLRMTGHTRAELLAGRVRWDTITPPEWRAVDEHILAQLQTAGLCPPVEKEYLHTDGHHVPVLLSVALLEGASGDCICLAADMTERKRAEKIGQESEQRLRSILDTMFVFVGLMDLSGHLVEVNRAPLEAAGLNRTDVLGRPVTESYWFSHSPAMQEQVRQALRRAAQGEIARHDYSILIAGGRNLIIDTTFSPLRDASGRVTQIVGSAVDVTARKQAELELRAAEQQLHTLVGRMNTVREEEAKRIARELHDDLGQQLTAFNMELADLTGKLPNLAPEAQRQLARMQSGVDHMIEVVQKISGELRLGQLDLLGLPAAIEWHLREFAGRCGIEARITRLDEVNGLPDATATAIFRILQETLTNIARHARATRIELSLRAQPDQLTMEIRDNGRGITTAEQSDHQAIGLLGMRERAEALGGKFTIAGEPGRGTLVRVSLPLTACSETIP